MKMAVTDEENLLNPNRGVADLYFSPSWSEVRESNIGCLKKQRMGNMFLFQISNHRFILGPHWQLLVLLYAALVFGTAFVYGIIVPQQRTMQIAVGLALSTTSLASLTVVALKDPGVVPRHTVPKGQGWTLCDRCDSFRPPHSVHCSQCNVCIEEYDHHCAWSSKCIGKMNMKWFRVFLLSLASTLVFDIIVCLQRFFQHPLVIYY
mmetsp:Transcript_47436/g.69396  ORF Transcript_47436/g.69396 Transcript_47436/m.69396 type:complete len:206 (+) Transcript_47436:24-641(+)